MNSALGPGLGQCTNDLCLQQGDCYSNETCSKMSSIAVGLCSQNDLNDHCLTGDDQCKSPLHCQPIYAGTTLFGSCN
jgi:hypothetical protein